jgi:hypothetical protein
MASRKPTRKTGRSSKRSAPVKSARKKISRRKRRLTDKIRAALARAASLGRRDVTEQLGGLYQARVEEELDRGQQRRAGDTNIESRRPSRNR